MARNGKYADGRYLESARSTDGTSAAFGWQTTSDNEPTENILRILFLETAKKFEFPGFP